MSGIRCPAIVVAHSVLLVRVCVSISVTTEVISISIETSWFDTVVVIPVPPVKVIVWVLNTTFPVPVSPEKSMLELALIPST